MKTPARYLIIASLLFAPLLTAQASPIRHTGGSDVTPRLQQVDHRIDRGVRKGTIGYWEARDLRHERRDIRRLERRFRADGYLSPRERKILSYKTRNLRHHTKHYRHNDRYRVDRNYWKRYDYRGDRYPYHHDGKSSGTLIFRW